MGIPLGSCTNGMDMYGTRQSAQGLQADYVGGHVVTICIGSVMVHLMNNTNLCIPYNVTPTKFSPRSHLTPSHTPPVPYYIIPLRPTPKDSSHPILHHTAPSHTTSYRSVPYYIIPLHPTLKDSSRPILHHTAPSHPKGLLPSHITSYRSVPP